MTFHWIDALTTPEIDVPAFPARSPSPGEDPAGEISLFTSSRDGIVALVAGKDWRWAHTALDTAGFSKTADGHRCLPLKGGDLGRTRDALHVLGVLTQMAGVPVIANTKVYIGDFARDLAEYLPGHWDVWVESYAIQTWQGDLAAWMWSPSLTATLDQHRVPRAALLKHSDGVELAVIEDPTADRFHVGTLHPKDLFADGLVTPPAGVTVAPEPAFAAVDISSRLLPAYARAVLHYQCQRPGGRPGLGPQRTFRRCPRPAANRARRSLRPVLRRGSSDLHSRTPTGSAHRGRTGNTPTDQRCRRRSGHQSRRPGDPACQSCGLVAEGSRRKSHRPGPPGGARRRAGHRQARPSITWYGRSAVASTTPGHTPCSPLTRTFTEGNRCLSWIPIPTSSSAPTISTDTPPPSHRTSPLTSLIGF